MSLGEVFMKGKYVLIAVAMAILLMTGLISPATAADVQRIAKEELRELLANPELVIVDVRTEKEWKKADQKIKGAVWEDADGVKAWADRYPKDKVIVLYCS